MKRNLNFAAYGAVLALLCGGMGCSGQAEDEANAGGYDAPVTVQLREVVVGAVGTGILLQNMGDDALRNVEIVINESSAGGGFRFRPAEIPPNSTQTYLSQVFKTSAGDSLNPMQTKPTQFSIYADTPRGRGAWNGGYENQR